MKRNIVIAALTATALIGGGTATALAVSSDDDGSTRADVRVAADRAADDDDRDDRDDRDETAVAAKGDVTAADAIAAALRHTPGTAASVDLEDDGAGTWDVDVLKSDGTEYTVTVSPDTGKVVGAHKDNDDDGDAEDRAEVAALKGAKTDAREAALAAAAKGTVTEVSLDDDDDSRAVVWNVDTAKGDWKVDLATGNVTADRDED
ncbi:PepSY domain-containing protein [Streptomyces justiciae]|uniref:PepSY domain-containing protein n=1 Tax=Streptomyces justiciae TaxID=2780140 RepID=UPI001882ADFB|nr:PepSY domain-containing protein [Streptomyces justiciae]MBE8472664.1 PepSY domain-containing protein [Streptomyces justiciae]